MAVIQKIRDKYGKLTVFVIVLALVGFILMDAASGRFGELLGRDSSVATVNGEKIDVRDYQQRIKEYEILYNYSSKGRTLDDATRAQINEQALRELINEKLMEEECEKLGIASTKEEERDLIYGAAPDPIVQQYPVFANPDTRMFDPQRVKAYEQQVDQYDPTGKAREEWEAIKAYVLRNNLTKKYNNLLTNFVYTPKFLLDKQLLEQSTIASARFVKVPFAIINDAEIKLTDDDLKAYMKKKEKQYTIEEPTRSIEYVSFDVMPSTEDTARALGSLNQLKAEFASSADAESFVNRNSEEPFNPAFVNKASFMSMYADSIMNTGTGSVYGPYFENGAYKMTKVLEKRSMPDSVKVRHILVKTEDANQPMLSDSAAKLKLDSAIAAINTGAPFATVVERYSDDPGSKQTAGEYTFTLQQKSQLSKEFADFAFEGNAGEKKTVKVDNDAYAGYHYIEIMEQKGVQPAIKIATVSKALYPGDATENAAYAKATEFAGRNGNAKAFDEAVKTQNLNKKNGDNVKANDFMIAGFGSAREVIRWMYDVDAAMRPSIEAAVRAEKKAEILKNKYKSSASVDAVAQATGQPVQQADSFNLASPFAPNLGYEPKAVGYCFYEGFKPNTLSPAITGQDGVIFMSVIMRGTKPMPSDPIIINQQKSMLDMQSKNTMASVMQEVLRKNAEIEYNTQNL
ncbi:MAG: hypothetical protein K0R82_1203 [Flavipsychrobacter sp.]|nr:hypothetical protein [Flavipsychrobacter sp.]